MSTLRSSRLLRKTLINLLSRRCVGSTTTPARVVIDKPADVETHTHQKWDPDDYRMVRFMDGEKKVDPNRAIDLIAEIAPHPVEDRVIACDGGGGALGHPKVFINLDKPGNHICGYCGLRYYNSKHGNAPFDFDNPGS